MPHKHLLLDREFHENPSTKEQHFSYVHLRMSCGSVWHFETDAMSSYVLCPVKGNALCAVLVTEGNVSTFCWHNIYFEKSFLTFENSSFFNTLIDSESDCVGICMLERTVEERFLANFKTVPWQVLEEAERKVRNPNYIKEQMRLVSQTSNCLFRALSITSSRHLQIKCTELFFKYLPYSTALNIFQTRVSDSKLFISCVICN